MITAPATNAILSKVRKLGRILLDQQMWCLGQDISHASGNMLVAHDFSKEPPPGGTNASSCYVHTEPEYKREVRLWGFGTVYSEGGDIGGSLYLERRKFSPKLLPNARFDRGVWLASEMPRGRTPRTEAESAAAWRLLAGISAWLSGYGSWVRREFGEDYRRRCVAACPKKSVPAERMPEAWASLARFFRHRNSSSARSNHHKEIEHIPHERFHN